MTSYKNLILLLLTTCLLSQAIICKDSDEPLRPGEEYTDEEKYIREQEAEELKQAKASMWTREQFFAEYDTERPEHPEVSIAKKYFPTRTSSINKERYMGLLKMYMDGTVHDEEIDEDIREEAHAQIEEFVEGYIATVDQNKEEFTVEDLFEDFIAGKFHDWVDKHHPQEDEEGMEDL